MIQLESSLSKDTRTQLPRGYEDNQMSRLNAMHAAHNTAFCNMMILASTVHEYSRNFASVSLFHCAV